MPFRYVMKKDWLSSKPNIQRNLIQSEMFCLTKLPQKKHLNFCVSVISSQWHWTSHPHQLAETCDTFPAKSGRNSTWTFSRFGNKEILYLVFKLKMNCCRFLLELMTEVFVKTRNNFPPSCTEKSYSSVAIPHISVGKSAWFILFYSKNWYAQING